MMKRFLLPLGFCALCLSSAGCGGHASELGASSAEDPQLKALGTVEVTARLVEIPEGAIFERDLYHYAGILQYEIVAVHRSKVDKGATIYVGHYDPWKPRSEAADKQVTNVGGHLQRFEAGQLHHMALELPEDLFDKQHAVLVQAGYQPRPGIHPVLASRTMYVDDPDGNEVEFICRAPAQ